MTEVRTRDASAPLRIDADLRRRLEAALAEDVRNGDVTSEATLGPDARGRARMRAKAEGVICGLTVARAVFRAADPSLRCRLLSADGSCVARDDAVFEVAGSMRGILRGERVALNFVQRLSGVATLTAAFVEALGGPDALVGVYDTRKTTPLWRDLERHAVRCGGGRNHRYCLDDMILIKDNHIDAAGSVGEAVTRARQWRSEGDARRRRLKIMSETRALDEVRQALEAGADLILLDNMSNAAIRRAVEVVDGRVPLEVSGSVSLRRAASLATLGVDRVSIGALTHSAPALDISLLIEDET